MDWELLQNASAITLIVSGVWSYLDWRKKALDMEKQVAALVAERDALLAKVKALENQLPPKGPAPPLNYPRLTR